MIKYIVYDNDTSYGITQEQFNTQLFLDKTLYDVESKELFIVGAEGLIRINPRPIVIVPGGGSDDSEWLDPVGPEPPVEPELEVPAEPEVEETPSEEEKTEN